MNQLNTIMNKYTCMNCGLVSVVRSNEEKITSAKCTCGKELVTLMRGVHQIKKAAPQNVVAPSSAPLPPETAKPQPPKVFNPSVTVGTVQAPKSSTK
jgi:hypothetical protein